MTKSELEQNIGQKAGPQRTRRIAMRGVGLDPETGVYKFAGEPGGPPGSIELSGEQLEAHERKEAKLMNKLYDFFRDKGHPEAEARQLAGIDKI